MSNLSSKYQLLLIAICVLVVFFPTQFAEISLVDDVGALNAVLSQESFLFWDTFVPRSSAGGYYRPLIAVSYWLDKKMWFLAPRNMHFESVLGHLFNCLMLFGVTQTSQRIYLRKTGGYLPFAVAMLFALHPVVTEPVNWISGRTDIMMSGFVLSSSYCFLLFKEGKSRWIGVIGCLFGLIALLAKEAALGYLVVLPLLLVSEGKEADAVTTNGVCALKPVPFVTTAAMMIVSAIYLNSYWFVLFIAVAYWWYLLKQAEATLRWGVKRSLLLVVPLVSGVEVVILLRKLVFSSGASKISQTVDLMLADMNYTISLFLGALGFYLKKFFLPLPLNFYIHEIDPLYDFGGILVVLLIMVLLSTDTLPAKFVLVGFGVLGTTLPFAFGTIAWNSYAERYLYLPAAFWLLAICLWCAKWQEQFTYLRRYFVAATVCFCLVMGYLTYTRNITWQTNVALMRDTVAQNPSKRVLREIYIKSLVDAGMVETATHEYSTAAASIPAGSDVTIELVLGAALERNRRYPEALRLYNDALVRTMFSQEKLLRAAISLLTKMIEGDLGSLDEAERMVALRDKYLEKQLLVTSNPLLLLQKGETLLQAGSVSDATIWLQKALSRVDQRDEHVKNRIVMLLRKNGVDCE